MWRMRHSGMTRPCWSFLKQRGVTCLPRKRPLAYVTTLRCQSSAPIVFLRAVTCAQSWLKKIKASKVPFTIVRSTQFFEFVKGIAQSATEGQTVRLSPGMMQPIAADDVAAALTDVAVAEPVNGTIEIAGPEPIRMDEFVRQFLSATGDARKVN